MENNNHVYILSGVDESMVGYDLDGWEIKIAHKMPIDGDSLSPTGENMYGIINRVALNAHTMSLGYHIYKDNPYYMYLEKKADDIFEARPVINALRLFKSSKLGTLYPLSFNAAGGCIGNAMYDFETRHHIDGLQDLVLSDDERKSIQELYQKVKSPISDHVKRMLELLHESYRSTNREVAFIMRVTILEMLIPGNVELSFRLSRYIATLLGKSKEESIEIYKKCKEMYTARSTYLHNGDAKKITQDCYCLALDYSRRVIANLIEIPDNMKSVQETLEVSSFGDNPYNVKF